MHHVLDLLRQSQVSRCRPHGIDEREKCREAGTRLARDRSGARHLPQARALRLRTLLQRFQRSRADAARRKVTTNQERAVVVRRGDEPQMASAFLDLGPLEKSACRHNTR